MRRKKRGAERGAETALESEKDSGSAPPRELDSRGVAAALVADAEGKDPNKAKVDNWAEDKTGDVYLEAVKLYDKIQACYRNKEDQSDDNEDFWSIYNAQLDENQTYEGNSRSYIPAVRDSINARMKRSFAQLFPANHKHVEAVGPTAEEPHDILALLEHYIRKCNLTNTVRADLIAGDVTGQWCIYVDWKKTYRRVTEIVRKPPIKQNADTGAEIEDITVEEEDYDEKVETKDVMSEGPDIVPFSVDDLAVYPPTCDDIEDSVASSIRLRMSKSKVQQLIDEGVFVGIDDVDKFFETAGQTDSQREKRNPEKERTADAGVKTQGTYKYALVYEVATNLELEDGKGKEPVLIYFAGKDLPVGIIKSPWWGGRRPTLSAPIEEITGSFFGVSKVKAVKTLQWSLNDYWNMGMDSAQYALLPIIMVDPLKNPQYQSMVMGLAAIWLTDPNSTKFSEFPALWKDAMTLCQGIKSQIWESMDVNETMMGKMPQGRKNNQLVGNMQQEQQINITDHAKRYEEMILNPLMERIFELDQQFRTDTVDVLTLGDVGVKAMMKPIEPQQFGQTYVFRWLGTSYQMNSNRMQQMIATMNVLRGIPPQQLNGRRLDVTPILEFMVEQIYGPELAPKILIDERNLFTIPPEIENSMMHNGLPVIVHPGDNHQEHLKSHEEAARLTQDLSGQYRTHIMEHMKALQAQMQQRMGQQAGGGMSGGMGGGMGGPGGPGGPGVPGVPGGAGPGVAGTPRPGAQPGQPRMQGPPGMIHADAMPGMPGRG